MNIGRWWTCLVGLMLLVVSCKPGVPKHILQPDVLENLLHDCLLAEGMSRQQAGDPSVNAMALQQAVLKKYGLTQAQMDSSMVWYMRHADVLQEVYTRLNDRMEREARLMGANVGEGATDGQPDLWRGSRDVVLLQRAPWNKLTFNISPDTTLRRGDGVTLQLEAQFLYQDGTRDGVALLAVTFANDSTAQQVTHISSAAPYTLSVTDADSVGIKRVRGFIYLAQPPTDVSTTTTLRLMALRNISLRRQRLTPQKTSPTENGNPTTTSTPNAVPTTPSSTAPSNISTVKVQQGVPLSETIQRQKP